LLESEPYRSLVDAIGVEELFTNGNRLQKREETNYRLAFIKRMRAVGKPVLLIGYARKAKVRAQAKEQAKKHNFLLLLTDRNLKTLGTSNLP
jgi:endo-alpha-1,4-polygalactosaminidase (GH114 family)